MSHVIENSNYKKDITGIMLTDMTRKLIQCLVKYQGFQKNYSSKDIDSMVKSGGKNNMYRKIVINLLKQDNIRDKLKFHDNYKTLAAPVRNLTMKETEEFRRFILQKLK